MPELICNIQEATFNFVMVTAGECPQNLLWPSGSPEIIFACGTTIIAMSGRLLASRSVGTYHQDHHCNQDLLCNITLSKFTVHLILQSRLFACSCSANRSHAVAREALAERPPAITPAMLMQLAEPPEFADTAPVHLHLHELHRILNTIQRQEGSRVSLQYSRYAI